MEPILNIKKTYAMIIKEEAHRKLIRTTKTGSEAVVFVAPKSVQNSLQCTYYLKLGHKAKNCYLLVGFPEWTLEQRW